MKKIVLGRIKLWIGIIVCLLALINVFCGSHSLIIEPMTEDIKEITEGFSFEKEQGREISPNDVLVTITMLVNTYKLGLLVNIIGSFLIFLFGLSFIFNSLDSIFKLK